MQKEGKFQSDVACKRGHTGLRYASSGNCVQCHRDRYAGRRYDEARVTITVLAVLDDGRPRLRLRVSADVTTALRALGWFVESDSPSRGEAVVLAPADLTIGGAAQMLMALGA